MAKTNATCSPKTLNSIKMHNCWKCSGTLPKLLLSKFLLGFENAELSSPLYRVVIMRYLATFSFLKRWSLYLSPQMQSAAPLSSYLLFTRFFFLPVSNASEQRCTPSHNYSFASRSRNGDMQTQCRCKARPLFNNLPQVLII